MRRAISIAGAALLLALLLACLAAGALTQVQQADALVLPGSSEVQVRQTGLGRTQVTYRLPQGRSAHDLRSHMRQRGWNRINLSTSVQQLTLVFVRSDRLRLVRAFATVTLSDDRRYAMVEIQRCTRLYRWAHCF